MKRHMWICLWFTSPIIKWACFFQKKRFHPPLQEQLEIVISQILIYLINLCTEEGPSLAVVINVKAYACRGNWTFIRPLVEIFGSHKSFRAALDDQATVVSDMNNHPDMHCWSFIPATHCPNFWQSKEKIALLFISIHNGIRLQIVEIRIFANVILISCSMIF